MKIFKRQQFDILKSRISEPNRFIQVVSGPRQVGKTTLVQQLFSETEIPHLFISADNVILKFHIVSFAIEVTS